jgi:hypothetical protein
VLRVAHLVHTKKKRQRERQIEREDG